MTDTSEKSVTSDFNFFLSFFPDVSLANSNGYRTCYEDKCNEICPREKTDWGSIALIIVGVILGAIGVIGGGCFIKFIVKYW